MALIRTRRKWLRAGFTLVELLTVIALIITIAALAVPNFTSMLRQQRISSAISQLQVAIMRARSYAIDQELDHSVEFCTDAKGGTYLRIEAESAYLEAMPNLQSYIQLVDTFVMVPDLWIGTFMARRDAWGASDGKRLYSGMANIYWNWTGGGSYRPGWGHYAENICSNSEFINMSSPNICHLYYDDRFYYPKGELQGQLASWDYPKPNDGSGRDLSLDEWKNTGGTTGYLDVDDGNPFSPNWDPSVSVAIKDNLVVDDLMYLPYDVKVVLGPPWAAASTGPVSSLINFDAKTNVVNGVTYNVADHGWDNTPDLRFGKNGHLIQTQAPLIVLKQGDTDFTRLQLMRGSLRLKKMQ